MRGLDCPILIVVSVGDEGFFNGLDSHIPT